MAGKSWEITEEQRKIMEQKSEEIRNEMQSLLDYNEYTVQQKPSFVKVMKFVNDLINNLKDNGELSEYTELRARIKAPKSALKNDAEKALDDSFGMEVITATEAEMDRVMRECRKWMTTQKEKNHDKPNGYKAKHRIMTFKKDKLNTIDIRRRRVRYGTYDRISI